KRLQGLGDFENISVDISWHAKCSRENPMTEEDITPAGISKDGKGKLLIVLVVVNILAVCGIGAYVVVFQRNQGTAHAQPHAVQEAKPRFGPLISMSPTVANLSDSAGSVRYARITLHLEVSDEKTKEHVEKDLVPIQNRMIVYLAGLTVEDTVGTEKKEK